MVNSSLRLVRILVSTTRCIISHPLAKSAVADTTNKIQLPTLSLFVTSVMLEYAHADYEMYTSMFAAIKCQDDRAGERGARADWAWEFWQNDWVFREDSEVWGKQSRNIVAHF